MNKNYLIYFILSLVLLSSTYALNITSPLNGTNINSTTNYSLNLLNESPTQYYLFSLNNTLMLNLSNNESTSLGVIQTTSGSFVFAQNTSVNKYVNSLYGSTLCYCGGVSGTDAYYVLHYSDGSAYTTNTIHSDGCNPETSPTFSVDNPTKNLRVTYIEGYVKSLVAGRCGYASTSMDTLNNQYGLSQIINAYNYVSNVGQYTLNISAFNYTGSLIDSQSINVSMPFNALLNVSVLYSGALASANVTVNGSSCIGSNCLFDVTRTNTYEVRIDNSSYSLNVTNVTIENDALTNYVVNLIANNALNVSIFDESTGSAIYSNATLTMDGALTYSFNHSGVITNIQAGAHTLIVAHPSFSTKSYYVFIPDRSYQYLDIYLNNGTAILFNYYDNAGNPLSGVLAQIYSYVNGTLVLVESKVSELGKVQWYALSNRYYLFNNSKTNYDSYEFSLNPVVFTSYDIPMSQFVSGNITPSAWVTFTPNGFYNGMNKSFIIKFISPYNSLTSYNWTFTYPGGSKNGSGSYPNGQMFTNNFAIAGGTTPLPVTIYYEFTLDDGSSYNYTFNYITTAPWQDKTLINMGDKDYGMLVGDKVFWITIMLMLLMGFAYLGAGVEIALIFGGFLILIFTGNEFLSITMTPLYYVSGFVIIILLAFRAWGSR